MATKKFENVASTYEEIRTTPGSAKTAGNFEALNDLNGFYLVDVASGVEGILITKSKKVLVDKATGVTIAAGEKAYWDSGATKVTNVVGTNVLVGHFIEAAASADTDAYINFDGAIENQET